MLKRGFVVFSDCLCAMIAMSAMERCSKEQCVLIVKTHYQNGEHYTVTVFVWKPRTILERHNAWGYTMFTRTNSEISNWNLSQNFVVSSKNSSMRQCVIGQWSILWKEQSTVGLVRGSGHMPDIVFHV